LILAGRERSVDGGAKLDPRRAALVVIDVQEAFRKAVPGFDQVVRAVAALVRGAEVMEIPIVVTEQYPEGLGRTVPELAEVLPQGVAPIEKVCFSASQAEGFDLAGRDQALVAGIEAHVCVNQTVLDLLARGLEVHVPRDATDSRYEENKEVALEKLERAGAVITSVETALFELVGRAGTDEFKRGQGLVLDYAPNP
jgi:nicotinamidase-related amidase